MDTLSQESPVEELHHWVFGFVPQVPVSESKSTLSLQLEAAEEPQATI